MRYQDQAVDWSDLRALRGDPPGLAGTDPERRAVFAAALEQAEQFLRAASGRAYATKPVLLFYALSQSGRAICAARAGEPWRIHGHGAKAPTADPIARTTVDPKKGALTAVAEATGSELWEGPVTLGELWASLPELYWRPLDTDAAVCQPLERDADAYTDDGAHQREALQGPLTLFSSRLGLRIDVRANEDDAQRGARVQELLSHYPRAQRATIGGSRSLSDTEQILWLTWPDDRNVERVFLDPEIYTESWGNLLYLRPGLGANAAVPSPLVTWWGVLLALSQLARYEPVAWREALDVDRSPTGHALETALDLAEARLPALVLDAITTDSSRAVGSAL